MCGRRVKRALPWHLQQLVPSMNSIRWKKRSNSYARIEELLARRRARSSCARLRTKRLRCSSCQQAIQRKQALNSDLLLRFVMLDSLADVLCPAAKLWNTGWGAQMMREAVSLMGGYGITEDCPGFLGNKWMDAQLEATYEGPEAVQRRQLSVTMTNPVFLAQFRGWVREMRGIASEHPGTGACALATAMSMWLWTLDHLQHSKDADGGKLYQSARQGVTFPLADALCWLAGCALPDSGCAATTGATARKTLSVAEGLARACSISSAIFAMCSPLAPAARSPASARSWFSATTAIPHGMQEGTRGCWHEDELEALEGIMPGINSYRVRCHWERRIASEEGRPMRKLLGARVPF